MPRILVLSLLVAALVIAGWPVRAQNAGVISLGACTGGSETLTHWGIGAEASGSTLLLYYGPLIASGAVWLPFTAKTDDSITVPGHTFVVDQRIAFAPAYQGSLPTGMSPGTVYWVRTVSTTTFSNGRSGGP